MIGTTDHEIERYRTAALVWARLALISGIANIVITILYAIEKGFLW